MTFPFSAAKSAYVRSDWTKTYGLSCHIPYELIENAIQTKSYAQSQLLIWKHRFWKSSKTLISTFYYCVSRFFHSFKRYHVKGWRAVLFIYRDDAKSQSKTTGTPSSVWKFLAELLPWVRKWVTYERKWVTYASRKFWFWGKRPYGVRPPLHVRRDEILHFKHPRLFAVNPIVSLTFRDKNNNNKADSLFRLNFNVYIDVQWLTEKELEQDKKQRRPISLEEKHKNFKKWEMPATTKVKMSGSEQKINRNT